MEDVSERYQDQHNSFMLVRVKVIFASPIAQPRMPITRLQPPAARKLINASPPWRGFRKFMPRVLSFVGPLAFVLIVSYKDETETALAGVLPYLSDIAEQNLSRSGAAGLAAATLGAAVDDYLKLIAHDFLNREFNRQGILRAFAEDHMRQVVRSPQRARNAA